MSREDLPVVDPDERTDRQPRPDARVWGVVLAAGTSSRYGERNKLLEPYDGEPLVRHATRTLLRAPLAGVTVVVGHQADAVRAAVDDLDALVEENPEYATGQSTSVATGVEAARAERADAVLVGLGDMPAVSGDAVATLVGAYRRGLGDVLAAACEGKRGNPVVFDARHFDALRTVDGDTGGRAIFRRAETAVAVETGDPGVLRDVDRPGDLDELRRRET